MQVYNSLTRRNEELTPLEGGEIRLYTCGPTVYNFAHIGNFRAYAFEDILRRVLEFNGWKVPDVLLSGNPKLIQAWQDEQALERTKALRPGLLSKKS